MSLHCPLAVPSKCTLKRSPVSIHSLDSEDQKINMWLGASQHNNAPANQMGGGVLRSVRSQSEKRLVHSRDGEVTKKHPERTKLEEHLI